MSSPRLAFDEETQDESSADQTIPDLERLAASVRWVQRAEAAARLLQSPKLLPSSDVAPIDATDHLPRAPQLPSVPGAIVNVYSDKEGIPGLVKPERLMPPPTVCHNDLFWPISILVVSVLATPIAYYVLVGRDGSAAPIQPQIATVDSESISLRGRLPLQENQPAIIARDDALTARAEGEIPPEPRLPSIATSSERENVVALQPPIPIAEAPGSDEAIRMLRAEEIARLMTQGEEFLVAGDVVAARIVFQRAAETGSDNAALALGATYDPTQLEKLGAVVGIRGEVAKARSWYQKAEELGSREARQRLEVLVGR